MSYSDLASILTPSSGVALTSAWVSAAAANDDFLYKRGPYRCTSATRPGSPTSGDIIFETDTGKTLQYSGSAWWTIAIVGNTSTAYNLTTISQSGSVTHTVNHSQYRIICGVCEWWFELQVTGSGSAGTGVTITTPVTMTGAAGITVGNGMIFDSSAVTSDTGAYEYSTSTTVGLTVGEGTNALWGQTPSIGLASGDKIRGHLRFRVASAA